MRFNIKKLEARGFHIQVDKDSIEIFSPPTPQPMWLQIKSLVEEQARIKDTALQDYAINALVTALHRAQVLEAAE